MNVLNRVGNLPNSRRIIRTSGGLSFSAYTNNLSTGTFPYNWDQQGNYNNALNFFNNSSPSTTGTVNRVTVTANNLTNAASPLFSTLFPSSTQVVTQAAAIFGYFRPNTTGTWSFMLGTTTLPADDLCVFWIGNAGESVTNLRSRITTSNFLGRSNYTLTTFSTWTCQTSLVANEFYPIILHWGQNGGGRVLSLGFCQTASPSAGSSWIFDATFSSVNYFFY